MIRKDSNRMCAQCGEKEPWAENALYCWGCKMERKSPPVEDSPEAQAMRQRFPCVDMKTEVEDDGLPVGLAILQDYPVDGKFERMVNRIMASRG